MIGDLHGEEVSISCDWGSKSYEVDYKHHEWIKGCETLVEKMRD
jgi:hypothetical protein